MLSDTQTAALNGYPLVVSTQHQQPLARLVLRNDLGQIIQKWLIKNSKCTLGSATGCSIRCTEPGIAPYHALLVIGARQSFVRALAPRLKREGVQANEILLANGFGRFEIAGYHFELERSPSAEGAADDNNAPDNSARLKFTLARPLQLRSPAVAQDDAPLSGESLQPHHTEDASLPWVAKLVQSAVEPLECQLQNVLEPLADMHAESQRLRRRRRKRLAAKRKRIRYLQEQGLPLDTVPEADSQAGLELNTHLESFLSRQSTCLEALSDRILSVSSQLHALELNAPADRTPAENNPELERQVQTQNLAIEQLQSGIVAVSSAIHSLNESQRHAEQENSHWKQEIQQQLTGIAENLKQATERVAQTEDSPVILAALERLQNNQMQSQQDVDAWKQEMNAQVAAIQESFGRAITSDVAPASDDRFATQIAALQECQTESAGELASLRAELQSQLASLHEALRTLAAPVETNLAQLLPTFRTEPSLSPVQELATEPVSEDPSPVEIQAAESNPIQIADASPDENEFPADRPLAVADQGWDEFSEETVAPEAAAAPFIAEPEFSTFSEERLTQNSIPTETTESLDTPGLDLQPTESLPDFQSAEANDPQWPQAAEEMDHRPDSNSAPVADVQWIEQPVELDEQASASDAPEALALEPEFVFDGLATDSWLAQPEQANPEQAATQPSAQLEESPLEEFEPGNRESSNQGFAEWNLDPEPIALGNQALELESAAMTDAVEELQGLPNSEYSDSEYSDSELKTAEDDFRPDDGQPLHSDQESQEYLGLTSQLPSGAAGIEEDVGHDIPQANGLDTEEQEFFGLVGDAREEISGFDAGDPAYDTAATQNLFDKSFQSTLADTIEAEQPQEARELELSLDEPQEAEVEDSVEDYMRKLLAHAWRTRGCSRGDSQADCQPPGIAGQQPQGS